MMDPLSLPKHVLNFLWQKKDPKYRPEEGDLGWLVLSGLTEGLWVIVKVEPRFEDKHGNSWTERAALEAGLRLRRSKLGSPIIHCQKVDHRGLRFETPRFRNCTYSELERLDAYYFLPLDEKALMLRQEKLLEEHKRMQAAMDFYREKKREFQEEGRS